MRKRKRREGRTFWRIASSIGVAEIEDSDFLDMLDVKRKGLRGI